ncbi:MAG: GNAT family N-acetyltransferase [Saccharospirillaceae bacterium]|nr:GNAT family N-acetyltransferase [Pseudomonadales bacterium]NRB80093.1 GNAT family N-acetyltransferase [Saccharospirillaceae bacterium]
MCVCIYTYILAYAWAPLSYDKLGWAKRLDEIKPFMAWIDNKLVGYADVQQDGYIDHFFVHGDYQRAGIATALMQNIINITPANVKLHSHVSLSAYAFFEALGFVEIEKQQANINGVLLTNFLMQKN